MTDRVEKGTGFAGQRLVVLPASVIGTARRQKPLLRQLLLVRAGYFPRATGHLRQRPQGSPHAIFIYCVKGAGWCALGGDRHSVRAGDLLVLPPGTPHAYGAAADHPWSIHWAHAMGDRVPDFLEELDVGAGPPILALGEDWQLTLLFSEMLESLEQGLAFRNLLHASQALGHLLALCIRRRHEQVRGEPDAARKIALAIIYMSERLDQPLRVADLAAVANLSKAHFTVLFKRQTGSSPRAYLQLLRLHQAGRLLQNTRLSAKEIAARVGYPDPFHFSRRFKALHGVSPSAYRARRFG